MTYAEFLILKDLQDSCQFKQLLDKYGKYGRYSSRFIVIVDDEGNCHLFDKNRNETSIDKVKSIGIWTFDCCTSLTTISIPNSVKFIGDWAFYNCTSLTSIKIPNSVKSIGDNAFHNCRSLKKVIFKGKTLEEVQAMENYPWKLKISQFSTQK